MAKFQPGQSGNLNGRPKGVPNKTTDRVKQLVCELVEGGMEKALTMLATIEDPKDYLDTISKYISYVIPKQEYHEHGGDPDRPLILQHFPRETSIHPEFLPPEKVLDE